MKFLFTLLIVAPFIFSCASLKNPAYIQFEESPENHADKPIRSVLILGAGKLPTRYFLDEISQRLIIDLKKKGIAAQYLFLGSDSVAVKNQFAAIVAKRDSVPLMTFFEIDFADVRPIYDHYILPITAGVAFVRVKKVRYSQGFKIDLMIPTSAQGVAWQSTVDINYNFRLATLYSTISDRVIESWHKNNFCN
ncbi:hypothetical protein BH11BAC5_BH11BAC5_08210 [soil metagenome]